MSWAGQPLRPHREYDVLFEDNSFVELPPNTKGRDFIVGDLHGRFDRLMAALDFVEFLPDRDRLIAVGDLIDKGPSGEALLRALQNESWFVSVLGNHEAMMRSAERGDHHLWIQWGRNHNRWAAYVSAAEMDELLKIIDRMPIALELPLADGRRIGVLHGEVPLDASWDVVRSAGAGNHEAGDDDGYTTGGSILWGRRRAVAGYRQRFNPKAKALPASTRVRAWEALQPVPGIDLVVSGHTLVTRPATPLVVANCVMLETAAFLPQGWLTLLDPLAGRYWQVGGRKSSARGPLPLPTPGDAEPFRPTPRQVAKAETAAQKQAEALRLLVGVIV